MTDKVESPTLKALVGRQLVSVCFVLDYVQLQFDQYVLAALSYPTLVESTGEQKREGSGYNEALCSKIGLTVRSVVETEDQLEIHLSDGAFFIIHLDAPSPPGPEMATLSGSGHFYNAWLRPQRNS